MKYKLTNEADLMLKTLTHSTGASSEEMLAALVWAAYCKPHSEWDTLLQDYRDRYRKKIE